jgi:Holliday junction resolvase
MDEGEVVRELMGFFKSQGWTAKLVTAGKNHFERDIVAEKGDRKYVIQVKGDRLGQEAYQIQYAIGEIVAEMRETGPKIHYGLAFPVGVAKKFWKFGLEGLRVLNLHLFIVECPYVVYHLSPERVFQFITSLLELGENNALPSTFSTPP